MKFDRYEPDSEFTTKFRAEYHSWPTDKRKSWDAQHPEGYLPAGLAELQFHDFLAFARDKWIWALSVKHPNEHEPFAMAKEKAAEVKSTKPTKPAPAVTKKTQPKKKAA